MIKRYIAAGMMGIALSGILTGCGMGAGNDIGKEAALESALLDAGVSETDMARLKISKDREDGRMVYEIRFDAAGTEYEYEVAAADGQILNSEKEMIPGAANQNTADQNSGNAQNSGNVQNSGNTQNSGNVQNSNGAQNQDANSQNQNLQQSTGGNQAVTQGADVAVSKEQAIQIALERVAGATEKDVRIELDYDNGGYKYEGDIIYEQIEYEFDIDANTGTILKWIEERY